MARKFRSFIDGFMAYTENKGSNALYRKWAAIFTVGAALERKVWITTAKGQLYPNQYIVIVGGAGVGKSLSTNIVYDLLSQLHTPEKPFHLAPTSLTKASLIDALDSAERRVVRPMEIPAVQSFNSLTVVPNEFSVFLPSWEADFMSTLTDLWDCKHYSETRRTSKLSISIPKVQLNIFSATTPAQLTNLLPEGAWEQGFMSRMLIIYSEEQVYTDLFTELEFESQTYNNLVHDLQQINSLWGERTFTDEAKETIRAWAKSGGQPIPDHPKLIGYNARRAAHLLKLCTIASVASTDDPIIDIDHVAEALGWLVEAETFMPDIFKSMKVGADARAIEECYHFAMRVYMKDQTPVLEHRLVHFLQERVPAQNVGKIIEIMERAKLLEKQLVGAGYGYIPKGKRPA